MTGLQKALKVKKLIMGGMSVKDASKKMKLHYTSYYDYRKKGLLGDDAPLSKGNKESKMITYNADNDSTRNPSKPMRKNSRVVALVGNPKDVIEALRSLQ